MKTRTKILFAILLGTVLIYSASVGYIGIYTQNQAIEDARKISQSYARQYANKIKADLDKDIGFCRALASAMKSQYGQMPLQRQMVNYNTILREAFMREGRYTAVWNSWEFNRFVPGYNKTHGRVRTEIHEFNGEVLTDVDTLDMEQDNVSSLYYGIKLKNQEAITPPYLYTVDVRMEQVLVTSIGVPVHIDGKFAGLAGIDRMLKSFQDTLRKMRPYDNSQAYLMSQDGSFIAHPNDDYLGKRFSEVYPNLNNKYQIEQAVKQGRGISITQHDKSGDPEHFVAYAPLEIGKTGTYWSIAVVVPYGVIMKDARQNFRTALIIGGSGLLLLALLIYLVVTRISGSLQNIAQRLRELAGGDTSMENKLKIKTETDELGQIKKSVNRLIDGLNKTIDFASEIGQGNLNASYERLGDDDKFGEALLNMRQNLREVRQASDKQERENRIRNWTAEGIAQLNDILRISREDTMDEFAYSIISMLVKYTKSNQGGLFFSEEDDNEQVKYIELKAAYAYNRRKLFDRKINPGTGLIGRVLKENRVLYLEDIPEHYMTVTSGLGQATPKNLLIVPLVSDEKVYGILEIASFRKIESYVQRFLQRASESIASAIASLKYSMRTAELLELSNKKSGELAQQEQDMRQNLNELRAVQDASQRAQQEMEGIIDAITTQSSVLHLDKNGKIVKVTPSDNENSQVYGQSSVNTYISELDPLAVDDPGAFKAFWDKLREGHSNQKILHIDIHEDHRWLTEVYTPITGSAGEVIKIIAIQTDITESKKQSDSLKKQTERLKRNEHDLRRNVEKLSRYQEEIETKQAEIEKLQSVVDKSMMRAELQANGDLVFGNTLFMREMELSTEKKEAFNLLEELKNLPENSMVDKQKELRKGLTLHGEFSIVMKNGERKWLLATLSPDIPDPDANKIEKFYFIAYDITRSKTLEMRVRNQAERLQRQDERLKNQLTEAKQTQRLILKKNAQIQAVKEALDRSFLRAEFNTKGVVTDANPLFINSLAYQRNEVLMHAAQKFIPDEDKDKHKALFKKALDGETIQEEMRLLTQSGELIWLIYTLAPENDEKGKTVGLIMIGYDISLAKDLEEEIQLQNEELRQQEEMMRQNIEKLQTQLSECQSRLSSGQ